MRILVLESHAGESDDIVRELDDRGDQVVRCQPMVGQVWPCSGGVSDSGCPFDHTVDVAIDVHPDTLGLAPRELGLLCAEQAGIPIVVAGSSPLGDCATETTADGAIAVAERLVRYTDGRVPVYVLERVVRREFEQFGRREQPAWVYYDEHDGVFDVVVETTEVDVVARAALDAALIPLFSDAMRRHTFGDVVHRRFEPN
jgi:hypothetical protein